MNGATHSNHSVCVRDGDVVRLCVEDAGGFKIQWSKQAVNTLLNTVLWENQTKCVVRVYLHCTYIYAHSLKCGHFHILYIGHKAVPIVHKQYLTTYIETTPD